jgi:hypothetical protein
LGLESRLGLGGEPLGLESRLGLGREPLGLESRLGLGREPLGLESRLGLAARLGLGRLVARLCHRDRPWTCHDLSVVGYPYYDYSYYGMVILTMGMVILTIGMVILTVMQL